ncbi:hypothetical protein EON71_00890 [bacterium]|nr:MAG: hypothetical protein EON71_00890 [bacterium]
MHFIFNNFVLVMISIKQIIKTNFKKKAGFSNLTHEKILDMALIDVTTHEIVRKYIQQNKRFIVESAEEGYIYKMYTPTMIKVGLKHMATNKNSRVYSTDILDLSTYSNITHIRIYESINIHLVKLPTSVTNLRVQKYGMIDISEFPPYLINLQIESMLGGYKYNTDRNNKIIIANLPKTLRYLKLKSFCKGTILGTLPPFLEEVDVSGIPIDHIEHNYVKKYITSGLVNTAGYLPNLTHIDLSHYFNLDVDNLPSSLIYIRFGFAFDKNIDNLPPNLETLIFGSNFNQTVDNLPRKIKEISFGCFFNRSIDNLPDSLETLWLQNDFNQNIDKLPHNLKKLFIKGKFNRRIDLLPKGLEYLVLKGSFNQEIKNLPDLIRLTITDDFNQSIDFLPHTIKYLIISGDFDQKITKLPKSLIFFGINFALKCPIENLPNATKLISFSDYGTEFWYYDTQSKDEYIKMTKKYICNYTEVIDYRLSFYTMDSSFPISPFSISEDGYTNLDLESVSKSISTPFWK